MNNDEILKRRAAMEAIQFRRATDKEKRKIAYECTYGREIDPLSVWPMFNALRDYVAFIERDPSRSKNNTFYKDFKEVLSRAKIVDNG